MRSRVIELYPKKHDFVGEECPKQSSQPGTVEIRKGNDEKGPLALTTRTRSSQKQIQGNGSAAKTRFQRSAWKEVDSE